MLFATLLVYSLAADAKPPLLVEASEIIEGKLPKTAVILDIRSAAKYEIGHLPWSRNVSTAKWSKAVTAGTADANFWSVELAEIGLMPSMTPVIVAGDDMREVCRAWWLLRLAGVEDVRVFNGNHKTFTDAGGKLSTISVKGTAVKVTDWKPQAQKQSHQADVLKASNAGGVIIDARSKDEFTAGRVPKAKHLEWSELIDEKSGKFKDTAELRKLFESRGIELSESPTCYCASGGRASVMAFAAELVSGKPARNYYRSWTEWGNDASTPKEK